MTPQQLFNAIFNASLVVMILTVVAGLGLSLTLHQILGPLHRVRVLVATVIANSLLAPFIAIGFCHLFPLSSEARVGVELAAMGAAGPVGMKAAQLTKRADMAMAVSFTVALQLVNIVALPLFAKKITTGATVDPWTLVKDLLLLVLAPLVIGQILRARYPDHAEGWQAGLEKTSNIALLLVIAVGLAANWSLLVSALGSWVLAASAVIVVAIMVVGYVAGRVGDRRSAITISVMSGMRFTPAGLIVIATVLNNEGAYLIPALIFSLFATVIPLGAGIEIGRAGGKHPDITAETGASSPAATTGSAPAAAGGSA